MKSTSEQEDTIFRTNDHHKITFENRTNFSSDFMKNSDDLDENTFFKDSVEISKELKDAAQDCSSPTESATERKTGGALKRPSNSFVKAYTERGITDGDLRKKVQALVDENLWLRQRVEKEMHPSCYGSLERCSEEDLKLKLKVTTEENTRLRHILKDVTEVNKRWQKYNQDRQDYVQRLLSTIQDLEHTVQKQLEIINCTRPKSIGRHLFVSTRHSDSDLLDPSGELAMLRKSHDQCLKENARLLKNNKEMHENFEELRVQYEIAKNQRKEREKVLMLQVNMFRDDFLAEQKEKNLAKEKIEELYEEIKTLRMQLSSCKNCSIFEKTYRPRSDSPSHTEMLLSTSSPPNSKSKKFHRTLFLPKHLSTSLYSSPISYNIQSTSESHAVEDNKENSKNTAEKTCSSQNNNDGALNCRCDTILCDASLRNCYQSGNRNSY